VSNHAKIFQLKIVVLNTEPPLWRSILVPENYSLGNMHLIVQSAFGFDNCHQHEFSFSNPTYGQTVQDAPDYLRGEETVLLSDVFAEPDYRLGYRYDFTDNWAHEIQLEKVFEPNPDLSSPKCIDGDGAGPLEDIGGPDQYNRMVKAHREPSGLGKLDEDTVKRPRADYEPELFIIQDINERLRIWDTWDWSDDLDINEDDEISVEDDLDFDENEDVSLDDEDMVLEGSLSIEDDDDDDLELDEAVVLEPDDDVNLGDAITIEDGVDSEDDV
jgi:hypothetical protein